MPQIGQYPNAVVFTRDQILYDLDSDGGAHTDSRFLITATIEHPTTPVTLPEWWQYGEGFQNLSSRLRTYFSGENVFFPLYAIISIQPSYVLMKYSISVREYWGDPLAEIGVAIDNIASNKRYVITGGTSFNKKYDNWLTNVYIGTPNKFLTTCPTSKRTRTDMKEFLTFVNIGAVPVPVFKVHVYLFYTDGTSSNYTRNNSSAGGPAWDFQAWCLPASYAALDIVSNITVGKTVWYYEVTVEDASAVAITETRRFYIDYIPYASVRKLVWRNSRGGEDSMYFGGNDIFTSEVTQQSARTYIQPNALIRHGDNTIYDKQEVGTVTTGCWLESQEEAQWLRDMRLATSIFEDDGTQFLPIEIISGAVPVYDKTKSGWFIEFEYRYRFTNHSYTP